MHTAIIYAKQVKTWHKQWSHETSTEKVFIIVYLFSTHQYVIVLFNMTTGVYTEYNKVIVIC